MEIGFKKSAQINAEDWRLKQMAAGLRKEATPAEAVVWELLRGRRFMGQRFKRQQALCGYVVDFYCHEKRLCIELDGAHHQLPIGLERDLRRDQHLTSKGFRVLRFMNDVIFDDIDTFYRKLREAILDPQCPPL